MPKVCLKFYIYCDIQCRIQTSYSVNLLVVQANQMLKVVNLSSNGFSNDGVTALADALKINSSLLELNITYVCMDSVVHTLNS